MIKYRTEDDIYSVNLWGSFMAWIKYKNRISLDEKNNSEVISNENYISSLNSIIEIIMASKEVSIYDYESGGVFKKYSLDSNILKYFNTEEKITLLVSMEDKNSVERYIEVDKSEIINIIKENFLL